MTSGAGQVFRRRLEELPGEVLDENAVLTTHRGSLKAPTDGNNEQCHGPVRELANQFYAAVQPQ